MVGSQCNCDWIWLTGHLPLVTGHTGYWTLARLIVIEWSTLQATWKNLACGQCNCDRPLNFLSMFGAVGAHNSQVINWTLPFWTVFFRFENTDHKNQFLDSDNTLLAAKVALWLQKKAHTIIINLQIFANWWYYWY